MLRIAVLGAGISGLTIGWFLKQKFNGQMKLAIFDKEERAGGWIETREEEGFLFEQGPRSCRTKGAGQETLALVEALGLEKQVILPHSDAKNRFVFDGKKLQRLPRSLWEAPFSPLTQGCAKALWRDLTMPRREKEDESIHSFFSRRIGSAWTENLVDPFISGIYAGDCSRLSLKSCFPSFDEWEQQHGSLLRGAWSQKPLSMAPSSSFVRKMDPHPLFSFQEGMETLPRAIGEVLKDSLFLGKQVTRLDVGDKGGTIEFGGNERFQADIIISTLPTYSLSALLSDTLSLSSKLRQLPYASVTSVCMGYHHQILPCSGFGYLIPSHCRLPVLGAVFDSSVFPQHNRGEQTRISVMMGGQHHPEVKGMSNPDLIEHAQRTLHEHVGVKGDPTVVRVKQTPQAIPQFEVGYSKWKKEVEVIVQQQNPSLILAGSSWAGVSINDCVAKAREVADGISF